MEPGKKENIETPQLIKNIKSFKICDFLCFPTTNLKLVLYEKNLKYIMTIFRPIVVLP